MNEPKTRRNSDPEVAANRARTLAENPAYREQFDMVRNQLISDIETTILDGSREREDSILEYARQLQALTEVRRRMLEPLQEQLLQENREKVRQYRS